MSIETKNAKITSTSLGYCDNSIMTFYLELDYGGLCQCAGGYALDEFRDIETRRKGTAYGADIIIEILNVIGVRKWENIPGSVIRVKSDHSRVYAIGHYLEDKWLNFEEFSNKFYKDL